jgi:hypothetical protein
MAHRWLRPAFPAIASGFICKKVPRQVSAQCFVCGAALMNLSAGCRQAVARFDDIIRLIESGESVNSIGRRPDMPATTQIHQLIKGRDCQYARRYAAAVSRRGLSPAELAGKHNRRVARFDDQMRSRIIELLEAGSSLKAVLAVSKMPTKRTLRKYCRTDPHFAARLEQAFKKRMTLRTFNAEGKYVAVLERIERGASASSVFVEMRVGQGSFGKFLKRYPSLHQRYVLAIAGRSSPNSGARYSDEQYRRACEGLSAAITVTNEEFRIPGLPRYGAMLRKSYRDPIFAAQFAEARLAKITKQCEAGISPRGSVGRKKGSRRVYQTAVLRGRLLQDELYRTADLAVPRGLQDHIRDDVKSDIVEAVLDGSLRLEDISREVGKYIAAHFARFSSYKFRSLDQTLFDDDDMTFIDRLTTDDFSYAD